MKSHKCTNTCMDLLFMVCDWKIHMYYKKNYAKKNTKRIAIIQEFLFHMINSKQNIRYHRLNERMVLTAHNNFNVTGSQMLLGLALAQSTLIMHAPTLTHLFHN